MNARAAERSDMSNSSSDIVSTCAPGQAVTGVAYKDAKPWPGVPDDLSDGVTVICDDGDPEPLPDLETETGGSPAVVNDNPYQRSTCPAGMEATGLRYWDRTENPYSDLTDAVSVVCRWACE